MKTYSTLTRTVLALGCVIATGPMFTAQAMPTASIQITTTTVPGLVQVRDHCDRRGRHRADHRFHGRDDYYDRDDQSGVLFKSFITGTLFRSS